MFFLCRVGDILVWERCVLEWKGKREAMRAGRRTWLRERGVKEETYTTVDAAESSTMGTCMVALPIEEEGEE